MNWQAFICFLGSIILLIVEAFVLVNTLFPEPPPAPAVQPQVVIENKIISHGDISRIINNYVIFYYKFNGGPYDGEIYQEKILIDHPRQYEELIDQYTRKEIFRYHLRECAPDQHSNYKMNATMDWVEPLKLDPTLLDVDDDD